MLIDDFKNFWKFYSVHALAVAAAIPVAWASVPAAWQHDCPAWFMAALSAVVAISGIIGRVIKQGD